MRALLLFIAMSSVTVFAQSSFTTLSVVDAISMAADAHVSSLSDKRSCYEADRLFPRYPTPERYWVQMSFTTTGVQLLSYALKKHHKRWWFIPMAVDTGMHVGGTIQTVSNCRF